jgi:transposase-like protein
MGRESKLTIEQKLSAIKEYNDGNGSYVSLATKLGISKTAFRNMVKHYNAGDLDAISNKKTNRRLLSSNSNKVSQFNDKHFESIRVIHL